MRDCGKANVVVDDVMMANAGRMFGEPLGHDARPFVQAMAEEDGRVVLRRHPCSSFAQPQRHLHSNDQEAQITHWASSTVPWDTADSAAGA